MSQVLPPVIVWFYQDLRLNDHPALDSAIQTGQPILPIYIASRIEEKPWAAGAASRWWLHHSLEALEASLQKFGLRLILRSGSAFDVLSHLQRETGATTVYWNRRYEPPVRARDEKLERTLRSQGWNIQVFSGNILYEPGTLLTQSGKPFQVFTPFWNASQTKPPLSLRPTPKNMIPLKRWPRSELLHSLRLLPKPDWAKGFRDWHPGERGALKTLRTFIQGPMHQYDRLRDWPADEGTSRLSPHLHFGEISPRQLWQHLPGLRYRKELMWREFAQHLLYHFPFTTAEPLRPEFKDFPWKSSPADLKAWQQGRTGYPIVDAGMRQLWKTGWMHNRVRMIVASFLVKDLLIPWQEGAKWFWDTLVDADLGNNTLGWQWAAGCGADAAPYFRIFNPVIQGERFDPEGHYVRQWIPELKKVPKKWVHQPWRAPELPDYPARLIDHTVARDRALSLFFRWKKR